MQGTVMMLMALSGLGCHNRGCDLVYASPTYGGFPSSCYANAYPSYVSPQAFTGCYAGGYSGCYATVYGGGCYGGGCFGGGCYGGGYSSCYSACYGGGHHGCGILARLFSCCGKRYGHGYGNYAYADFYGSPYGYGMPYTPSIYGYAREFNYGTGAPGEAAMGYQGAGMGGTPTEAAPPVPATPAPSTPATDMPAPTAPTPGGVSPPPTPKPVVPDAVPTPPKPNT